LFDDFEPEYDVEPVYNRLLTKYDAKARPATHNQSVDNKGAFHLEFPCTVKTVKVYVHEIIDQEMYGDDRKFLCKTKTISGTVHDDPIWITMRKLIRGSTSIVNRCIHTALFDFWCTHPDTIPPAFIVNQLHIQKAVAEVMKNVRQPDTSTDKPKEDVMPTKNSPTPTPELTEKEKEEKEKRDKAFANSPFSRHTPQATQKLSESALLEFLKKNDELLDDDDDSKETDVFDVISDGGITSLMPHKSSDIVSIQSPTCNSPVPSIGGSSSTELMPTLDTSPQNSDSFLLDKLQPTKPVQKVRFDEIVSENSSDDFHPEQLDITVDGGSQKQPISSLEQPPHTPPSTQLSGQPKLTKEDLSLMSLGGPASRTRSKLKINTVKPQKSWTQSVADFFLL